MGSLFDIRRTAQAGSVQPPANNPQAAAPPSPVATVTGGAARGSAGETALTAMHRAAYTYHARHDPPQIGEAYWPGAIADLTAVAAQYNQDPLIVGLLGAVLSDLERRYKHMLEAQQSA